MQFKPKSLFVNLCQFVFLGFLAFDVVGIFFPPQRPITADFEEFLYNILSITLFSYLNSWERASISLFNVEC